MSVSNRKKLNHDNSPKRRTAKREPRAPVFSGSNRSKATRLTPVDPQPLQPAASTIKATPPQNNAKHCESAYARASKGLIKSDIPGPQQEEIRGMYAAGLSMHEITRRTGRNYLTVLNIVRQPEMQQLIEARRQAWQHEYFEVGPTALETVREKAKEDGWLAHQVLKDIGVIPNQRQMEQLQMTEQKSEAQEEADVQDWTQRIAEVVVRQHKIFNLPLPQLEQLEEDEKEEKRSLLKRKDH